MKTFMKKGIALAITGVMCLSGLPVSAAPEPGAIAYADTGRVQISFNNDWRFHEGDAGSGEKSGYDDSKWLYVNAPHSTILYTPENYYQEDLGIYWYRRHFETPDTAENGRRVLLTFEGAMQQAEVWLNDSKLGTHQGGYTEFSFDITDYLKKDGSENVLAVKLDTRPNSGFAPGKTNPDFQYFGGLYRNVYVTVTDPVHITDAVTSGTAAGGGVFLTSPEVSKESAVVKAKTEVQNEDGYAAEVTLSTELLEPDGERVAASAKDTQTVKAGEKYSFVQSLEVSNPRLWGPDTPELYTVRTTVEKDGAVCDTYETTYGIRKVEWKRDGCYMNDERIELVGTNLHSETYMLGNAMSDDAIFTEVKRLRDYGFNFIRMAHYPHAPAFYEACDRYGVTVLDCLSGWQNFSNTDAFKDNTYQQMREMVRANRNHPSVVAWEPSLNESNFNQDWASRINQITKEEYPEEGVSKAYTGGWKYWNVYDLGVGTPQANVVGDAAKYSEKPVIISEYGDWNMGGFKSTTRITREPQHYTSAKGGDEGMLIQCDNIQSSLAYNRSKTGWYGAAAYWQYADYAGFDAEKLTYCGVVDVARIPKFSAYFYQSQRDPGVDLSQYGLESGPMVYIANTWADDSPNQVRVFSNCEEVELYLDDQLIGRQTPDTTMWDPRGAYSDSDYGKQPGSTSGAEVSTEYLEHPPFTFDLSAYTPGQGTLRAVGYIDGEQREVYVRSAPGTAAQISLQAEDEEALKLDGSTAKLVWVDVKDVDGTVVNTAENKIAFETEGPGFVIGQKAVDVRGGQWAVWVRSQRGDGDITLTASAEGLKTASLVIPGASVSGLPEVPNGGDADETDYVPEELPENIFLNKTATASSVNSGKNGVEKAEYANDGKENTKWCAKVTNTSDSSLGGHWWQADLGMTYDIESMEIVFDTEGGYQYQVAVSDDVEFTGYDVTEHETKTESGGRVTEEVGARGRYVRIYLNCPSSNIWPCLREVTGIGTVNNIALNKTAAAESSASGSQASYAVDGKADTFWNKGGYGPGWWQVDLGEDYHVDDVTVSFAWAGTSDNGIIRHSFTLQSSADGQNWRDITQWSDFEQEDDQVNASVSLTADADARYLRINNLQAKKQTDGKNQWIEIAEFIATGEKLKEAVRLDYGAGTAATSSAEGITPEYGNDGNPQTFWTPSADDANPSWQFDAAGLYRTRSVILTWNTEGEHHYTIETSTDGETWTTTADHMEQGMSGGSTTDMIAGLAKYIRVSLQAGTTDGFWINATGREQSPALAVKSTDELPQVTGVRGTSFQELQLSGQVSVTLEGDVRTKLPVTWSEEGFDAANTQEQTLHGAIASIPGVQNKDELGAEVKVQLMDDLHIVTNPKDFVGSIEETAVFTVEAAGAGLIYQWQYCNANSNIWRTSSMAGSDTAEVSVPVTKARDGQKYRCVVTDGGGNTVTSEMAAVKIGIADGAPVISLQPLSFSGAPGEEAVFEVRATGMNLTYQWQYCNAGSNIWRESSMEGNKSEKLKVSVASFRDGQKYRCVITSENGRTAISEVAVVGIK